MIRNLTFVFVFILMFPFPSLGQEFKQWGNLQPGAYGVGYKTIRVIDPARTYTVKDGVRISRPLQIYLWYPSKPSSKPKMVFGEYFNDVGFDQAGFKDPEVLRNYVISEFRLGPLAPSFNQPPTAEVFNGIAGTPTACVRDAEPLEEKFPLLIHLPGAVNQSVMIEFLVSHGYVVAALPLLGSSPATYGRGDASRTASLTQIEDIQFAFRELSKETFVDNTRTGVLGMFAQVGIELQMKDQLLSSIACLDCAFDGATYRQSPHYDPRKVTIPVLRIQNSEQNQQPSLADSLVYARRIDIDFTNLPHADFYPFKRIAKPENARQDINYDQLCDITLNFFNATLKPDKNGMEVFMRGLDQFKDKAHISMHEPLPPLAHEQQFLTWLREGDVSSAKDAYLRSNGKALAQRDPFFFTVMFLSRDRAPHAWDALKMFVDSYPRHPRALRLLNIYGYYFLNQGYNLREAKKAFQTMMRDYPESPYAHDAWADYLMEIGKADEALQHSQKVIDLTTTSTLPPAEKDGIIKSARDRIARINSFSKNPERATKGEFAVGFKTVKSKSAKNDPMLISIWYPASAGKSNVTLGDYIREESFEKSAPASGALNDFRNVGQRIYNTQIPDSLLTAIGNTKTAALKAAKPRAGKFPLVIAVSDPTAYHQLFERIASSGFVVASVTARFNSPNPEADSPDHYTRYTNLLEDLRGYMVKQSFVDTSNIAAFGHGGGIQAAMYLAMRSKSIAKVVNLDGGFFGPRSKTTNSRDYHPEKFSIPLLHIVTSRQNAEDDPHQFAAIKAPVTKAIVQSKAVRHHDFTAWRKLGDHNREEDEKQIVNRTVADIETLVVQFLQSRPVESGMTLTLEIEKVNQ